MPADQRSGRFDILNLKTEHVFLSVILVIASVLRFYKYWDFSFSNDELSALNRLRFDSFSDLVSHGFYVDGHPGGIQVFLWYWTKLFGTTEASLRFPFVLFGIGSVFLSFLVGKRMFGVVAGLFTAASVSFLEFPLLYSQIARPYGSGLFFCLFMVYFWLRVVFWRQQTHIPGRGWYRDAAIYILAAALCMYNHYFSFLFALLVGITGLFLVPRKKLPAYMLSGIIAGILFLPHLQITLNHLTYKGVGLWLGVPPPSFLLDHISFILNDSLILLIAFMIISVLISYKGMLSGNRKPMMILAFTWFLVPLIIGWAYSVWVNPVLQHPVLIFSFPFLIMLLFMAAGDQLGKWQKTMLVILLVCGVADTVLMKAYYRKQHFGEFKGVVETTMKWEKEFGANNMIRVAEVNSPYYLDYYFERNDYRTEFALYKLEEGSWIGKLDSLLKNSDKPCFLFAWTKPAPEGVQDVIRSRFPKILKHINYGYLSGITLFGREGGSEFENGLLLNKVLNDSLPIGSLSQEFKHSGTAVWMDSTAEYGPALTKSLQVAGNTGKDIRIGITVKVKPIDWPLSGLLVASIENPEEGQLMWKSTQFQYTVPFPGEWNKVFLTFDLERDQVENGLLKVYIWNKGRQQFLFEEFRLGVYQYLNHSPFSDKHEIWGTL